MFEVVIDGRAYQAPDLASLDAVIKSAGQVKTDIVYQTPVKLDQTASKPSITAIVKEV